MTNETGERSWWSRNWGCVVGCGCFGMVLAIAAIIGALFFGLNSIASSAPLGKAVEIAAAHPEVQEALGEPIASGWGFQGSVNIQNQSGNADYSMPLNGPNGRGRLYVVATKTRGQWTFDILEVEIDGRSDRIDLLALPPAPESGTAPEI